MNAPLILSILTLLTSRGAQNTSHETNNAVSDQYHAIVKGDTVKELGNNIMVVYQDKKNNYWFGSWEEGLYRYDGKTILHFTTKDGLPHNRIEEIQEDKLGNIYFNTSGGISKFDGQIFTKLNMTSNPDNTWKLAPGDLWFRCTQDSGQVYRYDGKVLHRLRFPNTKIGDAYIASHPRSKYPNMTYDPYGVYTIYKDRKGNLWFGGAIFGVCRYDGNTIDWISEDDVTELHDGPSNGVRSIIEDKDGFFWFNTMYRYDIYGNHPSNNNSQKQSFYRREKGIGSLDGRKDGDLNEYLSIAKDNNGHLWIATYNTGVWQYDGKKITHYPIQEEAKDITVFSIYKDNNGGLWLGTHAHGAFKFNGRAFERFKP